MTRNEETPDAADERDRPAPQPPVDSETVRVSFDDVAGIDEVEAEISEVVDYLKDPEKYRRVGARPRKGVLLSGAPGTGTMLPARATAGEANVGGQVILS